MATMIMEMPMGSLMVKSMRRSLRRSRRMKKAINPQTPRRRERKARSLKIPKMRRRMQILLTLPMMKERTTQAMLRIPRRPLLTRREESRRDWRVTRA
jgi:hypothetical protein